MRLEKKKMKVEKVIDLNRVENIVLRYDITNETQ